MPIGLNQNVAVGEHCFHVQTEQVPDRDEVVSHVFLGGRVLHTYRYPYAAWKGRADWLKRVEAQALRQHAVMVAAVKRGRVTLKI